jgi:hypothetical protein
MNFDYSRFYTVFLSDSDKINTYQDKIKKIKKDTFFSKAKFTILYCKDSVSPDFLSFAKDLNIKTIDVTSIKELLSNELDKKLYSVFEIVSFIGCKVNNDTKLATNILKILHHNVTNYGVYLDLELITDDAIGCNDIGKSAKPKDYSQNFPTYYSTHCTYLPIYSCLKFEVLECDSPDASIKELSGSSKELLTKIQNKFLQSIDYLARNISGAIQIHKIKPEYLHDECLFSSYRNHNFIPGQPTLESIIELLWVFKRCLKVLEAQKTLEAAEKIIKNNGPDNYMLYYKLTANIREVEEDIVIIDELVDIALDSCLDPNSNNDPEVELYTTIKITRFDLS